MTSKERGSKVSDTVKRDIAAQIEKNVRKPDQFTLHTALRNIHIERSCFQYKLTQQEVITFLGHVDVNDVHVVVNVVKVLLCQVSRTAKYVMYRCRKTINAVRLIRHFWLASRFRFAIKFLDLINGWRIEERAAKKLAVTSGNKKKRSSEDGTFHEEFLVMDVPMELKRRILLIKYRRFLTAFVPLWSSWNAQRHHYEEAKRHFDFLMEKRMLSEEHISAAPLLPTEPQFHWFSMLKAVTPAQRFDLCLQVQAAYKANKRLRVRRMSGADDELTMNQSAMIGTVMEEINHRWIERVLPVLGRYSRETEERRQNPNAQVLRRNQFSHVTSKIFSLTEAVKNQQRQKSPHSTERKVIKTLERPPPGSLRDLQKSMPTLSQFKGDPWNVPPRSSKFLPRFTSAKNCNPCSMFRLDHMAQSLITHGVQHAPIVNDTLRQRALHDHREKTMHQIVSRELGGLSVFQCSSAEMLRSDAALEITLGITSAMKKSEQERRLKSAPPQKGK